MELLRIDALAQDVIADLDSHLYGHDPADMARIRSLTTQLVQAVRDMTLELSGMNPSMHEPLSTALERIRAEVAPCLAEQDMDVSPPYVLSLDEAARQELEASIPLKPLCDLACAGICPQCGKDLNEGPCDCQPEPDARWQALREVFDQTATP